jgi:hypothetical protein
MYVKTDEYPGHSTNRKNESLANVHDLVWNDRLRKVEISYGTCQAIITKYFGIRHVSATFDPRMVMQEQKKTTCLWHLTCLNMQKFQETIPKRVFNPNSVCIPRLPHPSHKHSIQITCSTSLLCMKNA